MLTLSQQDYHATNKDGMTVIAPYLSSGDRDRTDWCSLDDVTRDFVLSRLTSIPALLVLGLLGPGLGS